MDGARTRGQTAALAAVATMVRGSAPQAVLLVGPEGVGKTTLALDLAAGLLCTAALPDRPCRACRACRLVEHGAHPDLHRRARAGEGGRVAVARVVVVSDVHAVEVRRGGVQESEAQASAGDAVDARGQGATGFDGLHAVIDPIRVLIPNPTGSRR